MLTIKEAHSHKILQQGQCPHCGGDQFVVDPETHEITCSQCVLVLNADLLSRKLACRALYHSSSFIWWILWYHKINFSSTDSQHIVVAKL